MIKKASFATAALAGTLLFGGAFQPSANAEGSQAQTKVYYSVNANCDNISKQEAQDLANKYFKDYKMNWEQFEWTQKDTENKEQSTPAKEEQKNEPKQDKSQADKQEQVKQPEQKPQQPKQEQANQPKQAPAPAETKQPQQEQQPKQEQSSQLNEFEQQVVELTNQEREKQGLAPLKVDTELSKVAREKSKDMATNNYFSHNSPTYGSPFDMMKQFGISYRTAGENIAKGQRSPQEVVDAWMNSAGHRKNILNADFTHIGVGYVADGNVWTQQFIGK